jgi:hypothetical protein
MRRVATTTGILTGHSRTGLRFAGKGNVPRLQSVPDQFASSPSGCLVSLEEDGRAAKTLSRATFRTNLETPRQMMARVFTFVRA